MAAAQAEQAARARQGHGAQAPARAARAESVWAAAWRAATPAEREEASMQLLILPAAPAGRNPCPGCRDGDHCEVCGCCPVPLLARAAACLPARVYPALHGVCAAVDARWWSLAFREASTHIRQAIRAARECGDPPPRAIWRALRQIAPAAGFLWRVMQPAIAGAGCVTLIITVVVHGTGR